MYKRARGHRCTLIQDAPACGHSWEDPYVCVCVCVCVYISTCGMVCVFTSPSVYAAVCENMCVNIPKTKMLVYVCM